MSLWIERYLIPICAAIVFGLVVLNPLKFDWQQRLSLLIALSAFAYFLAHTVHKPKDQATSATPNTRVVALEQQVQDLRTQQNSLLDKQHEAEEAHKRKQKTRAKLGNYLAEGQQLMIRCVDETKPAPEADAEKWAGETEKFLLDNLGSEYVSRFRIGSGMPLAASSIADVAHRNLWAGLNIRVYRLEQFLSELRD